MDLVIIWFISGAASMRSYDIGHFAHNVWTFIFYQHASAAASVYPIDAVIAKMAFMEIRVRKYIKLDIRGLSLAKLLKLGQIVYCSCGFFDLSTDICHLASGPPAHQDSKAYILHAEL